MTPIEQQFEAIKAVHKDATLTRNPDGTYTVRIPRLKLSGAWNREETDVWFLVPIGYPAAKPDCFWTTGGLGLKNGNPPQNTGSNPLPFGPPGLLWFSWHVAIWSPLSDSLMTYFHVVVGRLREAR